MKYIKGYKHLNESIEVLSDKIKQTYTEKNIEGITNYHYVRELDYKISEEFDNILLMKLPTINYKGNILRKDKYILYIVSTTDINEVENKKKEFETNYEEKSIIKLKELSDDKQIFLYNLYIAESNNLTGEKEFEYSKIVFFEGCFIK